MSESADAQEQPRGTGPRPTSSTGELIDVLIDRRPVLIGVAVVVSLIGVVVAAVWPDVLPPRPLAGAAVGLAACLLAVAAAVAIDAADRTVRGSRHIRATGAVHVATVGARGQDELIDWVEHRLRTEGPVRVAVAGAGVDPLRSGRLTSDLGRGLARRGWRVLLVDLHEQDGSDGISEVIARSRRLSEVVDYHPTLDLAEVGPGSDLAGALEGFPTLATRLPRDVDALLVALPGVRHPGVLPAVAAIDGILLLAEAGSTTRVELMAALDALDEARVPSEVVLIADAAAGSEPRAAEGPATAGGPAAPPEPPSGGPPEAEPQADLTPTPPGPGEPGAVEAPAAADTELPAEPAVADEEVTRGEPDADEAPTREGPEVREEPLPVDRPEPADAAEVLAELRRDLVEDTAEIPPLPETGEPGGAPGSEPEPEPEPGPEPGPEPEPPGLEPAPEPQAAPEPPPGPQSGPPPEPPPGPQPEPEPERGPPPPAEPPQSSEGDPLDRTPYAADRWTEREADAAPARRSDAPSQPDAGAQEPPAGAQEPPAPPGDAPSRDSAAPPDAPRPSDDPLREDPDREEALRLTATLENLANEIWEREDGDDDA